MSEPTESKPDGMREWRAEAMALYHSLPYRRMAVALIGLWVAIFHFLGNSTLGYVKTSSLFGWMQYVYSTSPDDAHGQWIPLVVLGLLWWKRADLIAAPKRMWAPALGLLAVAVAMHGIGFMVQQTRLSIVAFFLGLYAIMGVIWGPSWLVRTFFPWVLFAFCLPLGSEADRLTFPLRLIASDITVFMSKLVMGIGVVQNGTQIFDPNGRYQYEVAAACSGIRSLTTTMALAIVYAFVMFRSTWKRAILVSSGIPLAVLGNVVRLTSIIVAAEAFGQEAGSYVHDSPWLSLIPYIPAFAGLVLLGRLLGEDPRGELNADPAPAVPEFPRPSWAIAGVVLVMTVAGAGAIQYLQSTQRLGTPGLKVVAQPIHTREGVLVANQSVFLPAQVPGFSSTNHWVDQIVLDWLPKDTVYGSRLYAADDGFQVRGMVVLMGADRSSIHKPQICLTGQGWKILSSEILRLPIQKPEPYELPVMKMVVSKDVRGESGEVVEYRGVYLYWFVADGQVTADHLTRMYWMGRDLITRGVLQRWAYVTYFSVCQPGMEDIAYSRMKNLVIESTPEFQLATGSRVATGSESQAEDPLDGALHAGRPSEPRP